MSERPELPEGLAWRKKPDNSGEYFEHIYFSKQHRGLRLRDSSGTADPEEAGRRLRRKLQEIDDAILYGKRPDRTFNQAAAKLIDEFEGSDKTLLSYAAQADLLAPYIGNDVLRLISKDRLQPFIDARKAEKVSARTINISLGFVRRVLRLATYYWRDEYGLSWLDNCPIIAFEKGETKQPVRLSPEQQATFFAALPETPRDMALFDVNTGLRARTILALDWRWEVHSDALGETVFEIPGKYMKNKKPFTLVLNRLARQVVEKRRGLHPTKVFGERYQATDKSWQMAWAKAGLPTGKQYAKGFHNLRHTFATRLRDAGVDERDVEDLMHHVPKTQTRHYSAAELVRLKAAVEKIVPRPVLQLVA
jgi:integrase